MSITVIVTFLPVHSCRTCSEQLVPTIVYSTAINNRSLTSASDFIKRVKICELSLAHELGCPYYKHFLIHAGRWVEDHGVVHNMMFNSTTLLKLTHKNTLKRSVWWDNGALPLWITAQNQVSNQTGCLNPNIEIKIPQRIYLRHELRLASMSINA